MIRQICLQMTVPLRGLSSDTECCFLSPGISQSRDPSVEPRPPKLHSVIQAIFIGNPVCVRHCSSHCAIRSNQSRQESLLVVFIFDSRRQLIKEIKICTVLNGDTAETRNI